jgi:hypothetical protein
MPGVELGNCADAIIASIHDDGMSSDDLGSNIQSPIIRQELSSASRETLTVRLLAWVGGLIFLGIPVLLGGLEDVATRKPSAPSY